MLSILLWVARLRTKDYVILRFYTSKINTVTDTNTSQKYLGETLVRNRNHLLEPHRRRSVTIYGSELPVRLFEQVTKIGDRAFFAIKEAHHLWRGRSKNVSSAIT